MGGLTAGRDSSNCRKRTSCGESGPRKSRSGTRKSHGSRSRDTYCATAAWGAITPEAAQRGGRSDEDGGHAQEAGYLTRSSRPDDPPHVNAVAQLRMP